MARWFIDRSPQRGTPSVNLRRLLPEAQFLGRHTGEVTGGTSSTHEIEPGQVYVAIRHQDQDGHEFVEQALKAGASAVVVERPCTRAAALQVVVPDARSAHARIQHALAGDPSAHLDLHCVTGHHGKSVTAQFLRSILEAAGHRCGSINDKGWSDGLVSRPISPNHPSPEALASMLRSIVGRDGNNAVLELLEEDLSDASVVEGLTIATAIVTQVRPNPDEFETPDEEAIQRRRRAFARLTRRVAPGGAVVVNADDPDVELLGGSNLKARRVSFGIDNPADVMAVIDELDSHSVRIQLRTPDGECHVRIRLIGVDRLRQALAAAAAAWASGIPLADIARGLESVAHLPGRFEAVEEGQPFQVRVDEAGTADELAYALKTLRELCPDGRILCVIGAEGMGRRGERWALAQAVEAAADQIIFTSDNPRTEDPNQILDDLLSGCGNPGRVLVEPNRRAAIEKALALALPGDAVLIAGKGHHAFQILADRVLPFDDRAVAGCWLRGRWTAKKRTSA